MVGLLFIKRYWKQIGAGLVFAALWLTAMHFKVDRDSWRNIANRWQTEANTVVVKLREASGNDKVEWSTAAGQIVALGESNRALSQSIAIQNDRIDDMGRKAEALRARAVELKAVADRAEAQKASALRRLSQAIVTPGTRSDCLALIREADDVLNQVREASE